MFFLQNHTLISLQYNFLLEIYDIKIYFRYLLIDGGTLLAKDCYRYFWQIHILAFMFYWQKPVSFYYNVIINLLETELAFNCAICRYMALLYKYILLVKGLYYTSCCFIDKNTLILFNTIDLLERHKTSL